MPSGYRRTAVLVPCLVDEDSAPSMVFMMNVRKAVTWEHIHAILSFLALTIVAPSCNQIQCGSEGVSRPSTAFETWLRRSTAVDLRCCQTGLVPGMYDCHSCPNELYRYSTRVNIYRPVAAASAARHNRLTCMQLHAVFGASKATACHAMDTLLLKTLLPGPVVTT